MPFKIRGVLKINTSMKVQGYYVGIRIKFKSLNTIYTADSSGSVSVPNIITKPTVDSMFKNLPISNFGTIDSTPLGITTSSSSLTFTTMNPLFIAGQYFELPSQTLNVNTVITGAGTVYAYVQLETGVPMYKLSTVEIAESLTSIFIGTITTNSSTVITANTIKKISRFEEFRPSLTQIGGAFPVSSGSPTSPGTIAW